MTRTEFGKRAFSVCGPDVWNSLHVAVRNISNHSAFKRALKLHCSIVLFPRNVGSLYGLSNAQSALFIVGLSTITFYCIVLYCILSRLDTIHQRDRQTDGQTPDDSKDRAYAYCRAVKTAYGRLELRLLDNTVL